MINADSYHKSQITNHILLYTAIFLDATAEVAGHFTKQRLF